LISFYFFPKKNVLFESSDDETSSKDQPEYELNTKKTRKKNIVDPNLTAVLDNATLSCRQATDVVAAALRSSGQNVDEYNLSYSSIYRKRKQERSRSANAIKADFDPDSCLTLHWDGKIMEDIESKAKVDRIAVVVTGATTQKVLAVPKISSGTGEATATAVFDVIQDWGVSDFIKAFCFDTTSVNTGKYLFFYFPFKIEKCVKCEMLTRFYYFFI